MAELLARHRDTLDRALEAIKDRSYWSAYPESLNAYGEDARADGEDSFNRMLGQPFHLDQERDGHVSVAESSPYGIGLGIDYPATDVDTVISAATSAMKDWAKASPETRAGVCLEILDRLSAESFQMGHAVMHTTGQSFLMAFQAGGPHALDRGLEAVAYAYSAQTQLPGSLRWQKPQGSRPPIEIDKRWMLRPRGVAVTIGVSTFPTWNGYPGIFASLATGNSVIVKPHPETILPLAITVRTARAVIEDAGFDANVIQLLVDAPAELVAKDLVMRPEVGIVDYTGGTTFGDWLEANAIHAEVFTEKSGVNSVILDSAEDLSPVFRNLSVSMTMYSGQMCTTPQNLFVPEDGIMVGGTRVSYEDVVSGFVGAIEGLLGDDARASAILGAIKGEATLARAESAGDTGTVLSASRSVENPEYEDAVVRTPAIVEVDAQSETYLNEMFGPIIYVVKTASTAESIERATASAKRSGAITWLAYTTDDRVMDAVVDAAIDSGVSVAFNLSGGLFVNQSAAFSDFHVTGANGAGNASLTDSAFVASRFRVIGVRTEVPT